MVRHGRRNVGFNKRKIIESILRSESDGRRTMDIADDTNLSRDTVYTHCQELEKDGYIYKVNKQSGYHLTDKAYGYPDSGASSFGKAAIRSIYDGIRNKGLLDTLNEFFIDETGKSLDLTTHKAEMEQKILHEFAIWLGAIIEYTMIQALSPKKSARKILPKTDDDFVNPFALGIKRGGKNDIFRIWLEKPIVPHMMLIFFQFSWLPMVRRGLPIHDDNKTLLTKMIANPSLPSEYQEHLIRKIKQTPQMNIDDPYWSPYEMDKDNFKKLTDAFKNAFPEISEKLDRLIKKEKERIMYVEKQRRKKKNP